MIDGEARTPSLASGCLAGVTRALLLEWCDVVEVDEPLGVLDEAEEVFLVSTTRDVQPVRRIDDRVLAAPGPVTRTLAGDVGGASGRGRRPVRRDGSGEQLLDLGVEVDLATPRSPGAPSPPSGG